MLTKVAVLQEMFLPNKRSKQNFIRPLSGIITRYYQVLSGKSKTVVTAKDKIDTLVTQTAVSVAAFKRLTHWV